MKIIALSQKQIALVDDADFEYLNQFKWYASKGRDGTFYARRSKKGQKKILMHREIMNASENMDVDHRNHKTLDNQKHNLRICTTAQNIQNMQQRIGYSSKYKGVYWQKARKKRGCTIKIKGKSKHLGLFINELDAAGAYNEAAMKYYGEFALLNNIEGNRNE